MGERAWTALVGAAAIVAVFALPSFAQPVPDSKNCTGKPDVDWDLQIKTCTALIQSGRLGEHNRGIAYNNRGVALEAKGEFDRAIADYTQALALNPQDQFAYNNRGNAYNGKNDYDHAIADFSRAIAIDPKYTHALNNRGDSYKAKGDLDHAIADFDAAIALDPKYAHAYANRGNAYSDKGDLDRALADYNTSLELDPKNGDSYFDRGRFYFFRGTLANAVEDFGRASALDSTDAYKALWLDIANRRSHLPSRLPAAVKQLDMTAWPAPVVRLYLGQSTAQAALAAADDRDAEIRKQQICEANFYGGEYILQQGQKDDAAKLLRAAAADCPKSLLEHDGALADLKALGISP